MVLTILTGIASATDDEGLARFKNENFDGARSYYEGIISKDAENESAWFGLGVASYKQGDKATASNAFRKLALNDESILQSKALYNLAHLAFEEQNIQESIALFKETMVLDPNDMDAKYNYEFLIQQSQNENQQQNNGNPPEPSDEAKRVKREAERLVEMRKYEEALQLMNDLLQRDETAVSFQDFTNKIKDVYDIIGG